MSAGEEAGTSRMCQILETVERDVHCRVNPNDELFGATGIWIVRVLWPYITINRHLNGILQNAYLRAPKAKCYCAPSAIPHFLGE
jgi:hypothetical protein